MTPLSKPVAALLLTAVLGSCDSNSISGPDGTVAAVSVSSPNSNIRVGQSVQLSAAPVNATGGVVSNQTATWKTDNAAVATVESNVMVTGVAAGSALITATVGDKSGTIQISVSLVPVSTIEVSSPTNPLPAGVPVTLTVVAKDSVNRVLTGRQFTYTSSNTNVATVSSAGVVTGKTPGGVVITVQSEGKSTDGTFNVVPGPPSSISVTSGETYVGAFTALVATLKDPAGNTLPASSFDWSTSDAGKVSVSQSGIITGVGGGTATITARSGSVSGTAQARTIVVKQMDGGHYSGCFLDDTGVAYCWGRNSSGETGTGQTASLLTKPTRVAGGLQFVSIATGSSHGCGLTSDGTAYCWGSNLRGTLGDGTNTDRLTPTPVTGGLKFTSIAGGHDFTCALTAAGVAYCWGGQNYGSVPTMVTGGPAFVSISAGHSVACGIDAGGKVYCWGSNDVLVDRLGTGDHIGSLTPRPIASAAQFTSISSYFYMTCGVTTQNEIQCWGLSPVKKSGSVLFKSVAVGENHYCGLSVSNVAYCWGFNQEGQLGNSSTNSSLSEPAVVNLSVAGISSLTSLAAGDAHSCGISPGGAPYCWGRREALGRPSGSNVLEPAVLPSPLP
jgi:uncharacterized protein YjdB